MRDGLNVERTCEHLVGFILTDVGAVGVGGLQAVTPNTFSFQVLSALFRSTRLDRTIRDSVVLRVGPCFLRIFLALSSHSLHGRILWTYTVSCSEYG